MHGELQLALDLGLFERAEYIHLQAQLHKLELKARYDFILQFRANNQSAMPWRLIKPPTETEIEGDLMEKVQGTAAVLQQTKLYEELVSARGEKFAVGTMIDAFQRVQPNLQVTNEDIKGFMKVTDGLRTGAVALPSVEDVGVDMAARIEELLKPLWDAINT